MNHNIRFLAVLALSVFIVLSGQSQMVDELRELDSLISEDKGKDDRTQFQISADLTSTAAGLLGGGGNGNFHFGLQLKFLKNKMGYRYQIEFHPQTKTNWGNSRPVDVIGSEIVYLTFSENAQMLRSGFGIERGRESRFGRSYFGVDMPITYERNQLSASNYSDDPTSDDPIDFSFVTNTEVVSNIGFGLAPFLGLEFHAGKRIGFNLEAKADFNFLIGEGYFVDDTAVITKSGQNFNFRTFPLLDFRIHYRI